jgi:phosphate-selective porin OprO and OprP
MSKFILLSILFLTLSVVRSQEVKPVTNKTPYFNFKSGIGISTPDSSYSINIRFRIQNRFLMNTVSDEDLNPNSWEARVRRCRLSFTGHVYNPKLSYYLQLSFSRGDMDWSVTDITTQNLSPNVVRDAMIFYKPIKNLQLGFGQGKLPGNRQRVVSSGALQFYDRSPVNANFTLDRDFGFFSNYTMHIGKMKALAKGAITSGEGRNSSISNAGLAYTGRVELLPLGDFTDAGDYFEGDVAREEKLKISVAGGYQFNDLAVRTQGQLGRDLYAPKSYHVYLADFVLKYNGLAVSAEYIRRDTNGSPVTIDSKGSKRNVITGDGINTQVSYCFKSRWEIAARHSLVTPHKDIYTAMNQINQYGVGVTKYIMKHKCKTQFNIFYNDERNLALKTSATKNFFAVFQMEIGI